MAALLPGSMRAPTAQARLAQPAQPAHLPQRAVASAPRAATAGMGLAREQKNNAPHPAATRLTSSAGGSRGGERSGRSHQRASVCIAAAPATSADGVDAATVEAWNEEGRRARLHHLETQALDSLRHVIESPAFSSPAFPCALIAGDVVVLHLLHRLGALASGRVKVVFVDTFHLFPETYDFLAQCEAQYGFKAKVFKAAGFASKAEYKAVHGSDLFIRDIDEYDQICKVEPFGRALKSLKVDAMINGRRRDHGADRAHLELFEGSLAPLPSGEGGGSSLVKVQPLAYWEFRDCFEYLERYGVPKHPLHDKGFPSIGDVQTTLPVPRKKWFEYGGERSGRFQGLRNRDGSDKTECGIHVGDAREAPSSSLTPPSSSLTPPSSSLTPPSSSLTPPSSSLTPPSSSLEPPSSSLKPSV